MNYLDEVLTYAKDSGCSDVHFSYDKIVLRRNGKLEPYFKNFTIEEIKNMVYDMLDDKQKQRFDKKVDIDFVYENEKGRYRANVYLERNHVCAALRVINNNILSLEELGLPSILNTIPKYPRGLVLITGATGSGKSTTLAAIVDLINKTRNCHILTIEDPIEYIHTQKQAMIHQREIGNDVVSFDDALKSAMREDPDVILVGEMRDYETISAAITLAETGHLVLSTLHTSSAVKTIDRIIDVFPAHRQNQVRMQLSGVINAIVTQELVPNKMEDGRIVATEILMANDAVRNLIRENKIHQIKNIMQTGVSMGMHTLNMNLAKLVKENRISMKTALQYASDESELKQCIDY